MTKTPEKGSLTIVILHNHTFTFIYHEKNNILYFKKTTKQFLDPDHIKTCFDGTHRQFI